jgi:hypothetical protein
MYPIIQKDEIIIVHGYDNSLFFNKSTCLSTQCVGSVQMLPLVLLANFQLMQGRKPSSPKLNWEFSHSVFCIGKCKAIRHRVESLWTYALTPCWVKAKDAGRLGAVSMSNPVILLLSRGGILRTSFRKSGDLPSLIKIHWLYLAP